MAFIINYNKLSLFLFLATLLTLSQGDKIPWQTKYPFIRPSSSFSSPSPSPSPPSSSAKSIPSNGGGKKEEYDYIVVGGGSAGCPLAATLSQNYRVLLLERGGVPFANRNVSFLSNFHLTLADTSDSSASQYFVSNDGVFNARARVLGGGTSINAGFYTRASTSYVKSVGWDAKLVNESYPWVEKQIVHEPVFEPWQRAVRDGLLDVGVSPNNGFTYDHLYGTKVGGTIFDKYGRRHTAAELLSSANPQNLDVLIHARVQKVTFDTNGKKPRAIGVVFKDENGDLHEAFISRKRGSEVIVTSGAIGSPQLLLLSGIGPKDDLEKLNISVVHDNEFVGKNMSDNPMNAIYVPFNRPVKQSLIETVGITKMGVFIEASSGYGQSSDSIHCHHGITSAEIGQLSTIPPKKRTEMNGIGGCCIARHEGRGGCGGLYGMSKVERIMLKYRPIAPKPVAAGSGSGGSTTETSDGYVKCGRGKRKYVRVNGNKKKNGNSKRGSSENKKATTSLCPPPPSTGEDTVVTLSLLPETPDRKENSQVTGFADLLSSTQIKKCKCNNNKKTAPAPVWLSFDNKEQKVGFDPVVVKPPPPPPPRRLQVVSYVTVECVRESWIDGLGIEYCTDKERVMNMEKDTCPGFISDGQDRVVWTNKAFRQMVGVGDVISGEDMSVVLVRKNNWMPSPVRYPTFTCKVTITSAVATYCNGTTPSPASPTRTLPCDVWRMERGACAWRLDVKAALSLGR